VLVLHFDYPSAASAVAVLRLQRIADAGGDVAFAGVDSLGLDVALPVTLDQLAELDRFRGRALELGLEMRPPSRWPPTLAAHLVGELAEDMGLGASWRAICLEAYWGHDADLGDDLVLTALAADAGLDQAAVVDRLGDQQLLRASRHRSVTRRRRGVGGVPVIESHGTLLPAELDDEDLRELAFR
jgi:2-hydroxychromene-2-carboxylate isomerase